MSPQRFFITKSAFSANDYHHAFNVMGYELVSNTSAKKVIDTPTLFLVGPNQEGAIAEIKRMFESSSANEIHISINSQDAFSV